MEASKRITNEKNNLLTLVKEKLDYCMINEKKVCISIENTCTTCLQTIIIEGIELNEEYIYLYQGNFEFSIFLNGIKITYYENEKCFKFESEDTKIMLFLINC